MRSGLKWQWLKRIKSNRPLLQCQWTLCGIHTGTHSKRRCYALGRSCRIDFSCGWFGWSLEFHPITEWQTVGWWLQGSECQRDEKRIKWRAKWTSRCQTKKIRDGSSTVWKAGTTLCPTIKETALRKEMKRAMALYYPYHSTETKSHRKW